MSLQEMIVNENDNLKKYLRINTNIHHITNVLVCMIFRTSLLITEAYPFHLEHDCETRTAVSVIVNSMGSVYTHKTL